MLLQVSFEVRSILGKTFLVCKESTEAVLGSRFTLTSEFRDVAELEHRLYLVGLPIVIASDPLSVGVVQVTDIELMSLGFEMPWPKH